MKNRPGIKGKFIFLISGIIAIPFLSAILLFFSAFLQSPLAGTISPLQFLMNKEIPADIEINWENLKNNFLPPDSHLLVFEHNSLVYSNLDLTVDASYTNTEIRELIEKHQVGRQTISYRQNLSENKDLRIIVFFQEIKSADFSNRGINFGMLMIFVLIGFTVLMTLIILRSISKSVRYLESATRKIINGDLDFSIQFSGKDEFASFANSFEIMRKALKEEREVRARTLMGVSHDLKTPLSSIKGYIEALQDNMDKTARQRKKYLAIASEKADLLQERISDLISYVKMETGEWELQLQKMNAEDLFHDISREISDECIIRKRSFEYISKLEKRCIVKVDEKLLRRVFENIIDNSIRYSSPDDKLSLTVSSGESEIVILIQDSGKGMSGDLLNDIFKPFTRGDQGRNSSGFGLGLTVAKTIITNHGGKIKVASAEGKGSCFEITLPVNHD